MDGIAARLEMLGHQLEWGTFNESIRISASSVGIFDMIITGEITPSSCDWCNEHVGRVYRSNRGFIPQLPKHPHCVHYWELIFVSEK